MHLLFLHAKISSYLNCMPGDTRINLHENHDKIVIILEIGIFATLFELFDNKIVQQPQRKWKRS